MGRNTWPITLLLSSFSVAENGTHGSATELLFPAPQLLIMLPALGNTWRLAGICHNLKH